MPEDRQHPHTEWISGGRTYTIDTDCNCAEGSGLEACLTSCREDHDELVAVAQVLHPVDP